MSRLDVITSRSHHIQLEQVWCVWSVECIYDTCMWVHGHMAAGFKLQVSSSVALYLPYFFSPYLLMQGHSLNLEFTFSAHWLANELQGSILWAWWLQTHAFTSSFWGVCCRNKPGFTWLLSKHFSNCPLSQPCLKKILNKILKSHKQTSSSKYW